MIWAGAGEAQQAYEASGRVKNGILTHVSHCRVRGEYSLIDLFIFTQAWCTALGESLLLCNRVTATDYLCPIDACVNRTLSCRELWRYIVYVLFFQPYRINLIYHCLTEKSFPTRIPGAVNATPRRTPRNDRTPGCACSTPSYGFPKVDH